MKKLLGRSSRPRRLYSSLLSVSSYLMSYAPKNNSAVKKLMQKHVKKFLTTTMSCLLGRAKKKKLCLLKQKKIKQPKKKPLPKRLRLTASTCC